MQLTINQQTYDIPDEPDRPLLWVLRDELGLIGTKFGCGAGICGSCTVQVDGTATRSCITNISSLEGKEIRTIEGLAEVTADGEEKLHPVQQAFLEVEVHQCGWCQSGQIMTAVALLGKNPVPTAAQIKAAMNNVYCRCGTYDRVRQAVERAAEIGQEG